jgi:UDP-N-acetylmuramyl pentapeptide synthase
MLKNILQLKAPTLATKGNLNHQSGQTWFYFFTNQ